MKCSGTVAAGLGLARCRETRWSRGTGLFPSARTFLLSLAVHAFVIAFSFFYSPAAAVSSLQAGATDAVFSAAPGAVADAGTSFSFLFERETEEPPEETVETGGGYWDNAVVDLELSLGEISVSEGLPVAKPAQFRKPSDSGGGPCCIVEMSQDNIPPDYPPLARRMGWHGDVRLEVQVNPDGSASKVRIAGSSGYSILDATAKAAVEKWRFRVSPFIVSAEVEVVVRFHLQRPGGPNHVFSKRAPGAGQFFAAPFFSCVLPRSGGKSVPGVDNRSGGQR